MKKIMVGLFFLVDAKTSMVPGWTHNAVAMWAIIGQLSVAYLFLVAGYLEKSPRRKFIKKIKP
jgi:O-antigen/teichoic acid export membrane protein